MTARPPAVPAAPAVSVARRTPRALPRRLAAPVGTAVAMLVLLAACTAESTDSDVTAAATPVRPSAEATSDPDAASDQIVGSVIRFTTGLARIDVTIEQDSPAVRDFVSMLPMTLVFEDFAGNEKISYLPRELDHAETPGSALHRGDFLYYIPWGNVGFWYSDRTAGLSGDSLVLGTFDPAADLALFDGASVLAELVP